MASITGKTAHITGDNFYQACATEGESGRWSMQIAMKEST